MDRGGPGREPLLASGRGARQTGSMSTFVAQELAPRGVFVATVSIGVQVERDGTKADPDRIAEVFWNLHEKQNENDVIYA